MALTPLGLSVWFQQGPHALTVCAHPGYCNRVSAEFLSRKSISKLFKKKKKSFNATKNAIQI